MKLYGAPLSPYVRKVLFLLHELGLDFEHESVPPRDTGEAFRRCSPLGRIPGFADGDFRTWDSSAISHYLTLREGSDLIPQTDAARRAQVVLWDQYADEDLAPTVLVPFFEYIVRPLRLGESPDEERAQHALTEALPPILELLDGRLAGNDGNWMLGDEFTYADIALAGHLSSLLLIEHPIDAERWPSLATWFQQIQQRPAFQTSYRAAVTLYRKLMSR